jgi:cysteine-rich repeat protein
MPRLLVALPGAVLALIVSGCNVFDPALYMKPPVVPDAGPVEDAAPDAGGPEAPPASAFSDRCLAITPLGASTSISLDIDTNNFKGDFSEVVACVGHDLPGNDGFVALDMVGGQKWHVHVNPVSADFDPAVYILASCDERACSKVTAIDECGPGKSEHLSFLAPQTGTYFVGIDSAVRGGGVSSVLIFRPTCGNGTAEHSETCDDNNNLSGDGCDSLCRKEFTAASVTELEPNDDPRAANVLAVAGKSMIVSGLVASRCDHDMYSVTLTQTGTIRATVSPTTAACGIEGAAINLALIGADGLTPVSGVTNTLAADCPSLEGKDLPAGEYFIVIRRPAGEMSWPYQMQVDAP